MPTLSQSPDVPHGTQNMKTEVRESSLEMSAGETFGKHSDNDDLNQFGYEAQLEVSECQTIRWFHTDMP